MLVRRFLLTAFVVASTAGIGAPGALANVPASIAVYGASSEATVPGASFPQPLNVIVTDSGGSPVAGVKDTFAVTPEGSAGGYVSPATATTNSAGIATATAVANSHEGFYPVNASVAGVTNPASFELGNVPTGYAVGDQLASLSAPDENGTTQSVSNYLNGGKSYVLLEISAVWCGPSNQFAHSGNIQAAIAYAKAHGVNVNEVTLLTDGPTQGVPSTQASAENWHNIYHISPVLQANGDATGALYHAGEFLLGLPAAIPTTLLVSPQGKILDSVQGIQSAGALQSRIMHFAAGQVNFYPPFSSSGVGQAPDGVALGSFTDGNEPDLVVANFEDSTVSLLSRNTADDGYNAAQNFAVGDGPGAVAVGVLDNGN